MCIRDSPGTGGAVWHGPVGAAAARCPRHARDAQGHGRSHRGQPARAVVRPARADSRIHQPKEDMTNKLKARLKSGKACGNAWLAIPSGFSAEVMAQCGWDSVTVDMQHLSLIHI